MSAKSPKNPPELLTAEYKRQITLKHETRPWGGGGASWIPEICRMLQKYGLRDPSVLEYGCGRRTLARDISWLLPQVRLYEYDPGVPGFDTVPQGMFDIIVCTDVMEHVEEQFVDATLDRLHDMAKHGVLFCIATTPAKSMLPNGQNAHVTVREPQWWHDRLARRWGELERRNEFKQYTVVATR